MNSTDTHTDEAAARGLDDLTARADAEAIRLAWTLPAADVAAAMHGTARKVAARLHGSTQETAARADALARALKAISNGLDTDHAINAASRDAVADAVQRAAAETLWSLDATLSDGTTTLADMLDDEAGTAGSARLSQYDEGAGIYRGVARVPHPEDVTRPLEMPAPEQMQEAARDSLTPEAARLLDLTIAANVAAEMQRRAYVAECADVARAVAADVAALAAGSRSRRASAARKTEKEAREATRKAKQAATGTSSASDRPYRPRTTEVAAALGITTRGERTARIGRDQETAAAAYWTHREALAAAALDAWTERINEAAEIQRNRRAALPASQRNDAPTRWERVTTYGLIALARNARRNAALAAHDAATPAPLTERAKLDTTEAHRVLGHTDADPRDADTLAPGQTRPRRALAEWDNGRALPGSSRRPSARLASAKDPAHDPQRSRTHADAERLHRQPAPSAAPLPRAYVPANGTAVPAAPVAAYVVTDTDRAEFAARRADAARIARALVSVGWPASGAYALAYEV